MKVPCTFLLDDNGEAYDLYCFCSDRCRSAFSPRRDWTQYKDTETEGRVSGDTCDHCGEVLPDSAPNDSCPICGSDIGESSNFKWHFPNEDCRSLRDPITTE